MKLLASWVPFRNRWYVVIDVQGNVNTSIAFLARSCSGKPPQDHCCYIGAIFSLKFTKNRWTRWGSLSARPDHLALTGSTSMKMVLRSLICGPDLPLVLKLHIIWSVNSQENHWNYCHQMSDFNAKMHQIRFRLGLCPRPRCGSLQRSPRPPSCITGGLLLREGKGARGNGREP